MLCKNYPEFESHRDRHSHFKKMISDVILKLINSDNLIISADLIHYLKGWWEYHVREEDMKYKTILKNK